MKTTLMSTVTKMVVMKTTLSHKIKRSQGGTNDPENLETLCAECHASENERRFLWLKITYWIQMS